jgi:hypothetical protein
VAFSPALAAELPAPVGARFPIVDEAAVAAEAGAGGPMGGQQQQPRRNFPETWIWTPDDFGTRRVSILRILMCSLTWNFGGNLGGKNENKDMYGIRMISFFHNLVCFKMYLTF